MSRGAAPRSLDEALRTVGVSLEGLLGRPGLLGLALVGSRAVRGLAREDSDWDVLALVGAGFGRVPLGWHGDQCQLMAEDPSRPGWLARDLAGHALEYGVWISGAPTWGREDLDHAGALARAAASIRDEVGRLQVRWDKLLPVYRRKYARRFATQTARARCHERGEPVPPTAMLRLDPCDVAFVQDAPAAFLAELAAEAEACVEGGRLAEPRVVVPEDNL